MDEFDGPIRRSSSFPPLLTALLLGALCGGGLGLQGRDLRSIGSDLQKVLDAPALGGQGAAPAQEWTPRQDPARLRQELERNLTDAWPADRLSAPAQRVHYALVARSAVIGAR